MKTQPFLTKDIGGHWRTVYSEQAENSSDEFYEALEIMDYDPKNAEKKFKNVIEACGNSHIDAILHLGILYNETKKSIVGNSLIYKAHAIALEAIPKEFNPDKDELLWGHLDNRPILRTFHAIGLEYMKEGKFEQAISKFEFLIKVNPNDNQGVRFLIEECKTELSKSS